MKITSEGNKGSKGNKKPRNAKPATSTAVTTRFWDTSQKIVPRHENYLKVVKAFNPETCRMRAIQSVSSFGHLSGFVESKTPNGSYFYKDNGGSVLAVAHLDSVQSSKRFVRARTTESNKLAYLSETVDDRLGAYVVIDLLPALGITDYDVLLTEGEEIGISTAMHFEPPSGKQYKWMFSFDREGIDVVMYQYDTKEQRTRVERVGGKVGIGSFSDICFLDDLKCCGFNFGTGYYNNHSRDAYFVKHHLLNQVAMFLSFWRKYKNTHMPAPVSTYKRSRVSSWGSYGATGRWGSRNDYLDSDGDWSGYSWDSRWNSETDYQRKKNAPLHASCRICSYHGLNVVLKNVREDEVRYCGKCNSKWIRMWSRTIQRVFDKKETLRCTYCNGRLETLREDWMGTTASDASYYTNYNKCSVCGAKFYTTTYTKGKQDFLRLVPYGLDTVELENAFQATDQEITDALERETEQSKTKMLGSGSEQKYKDCDMCGLPHELYDLTTINGGWLLCPDCIEVYTNYCSGCDNYYMITSAYSTCPKCGKSETTDTSGNKSLAKLELWKRCYICLRTEEEAGKFAWTIHGGKNKLCKDCASTYIKVCSICNQPFFLANNIKPFDTETEFVCNKCKVEESGEF
jgi:hypothetical protein